MRGLAVTAIAAHLASALPSLAQVQVFGNYDQFVAAVGNVRTIDFRTLPDGRPSGINTALTETFNYDAQGTHFSALFPYPTVTGGTLNAVPPSTGDFDWIAADLAAPARGVGMIFPGSVELCIYDGEGSQISCWSGSSPPGGEAFLAIASFDVPIGRARFYRVSSVSIDDFVFASVPEPAASVLMGVGAIAFLSRRPRTRPGPPMYGSIGAGGDA